MLHQFALLKQLNYCGKELCALGIGCGQWTLRQDQVLNVTKFFHIFLDKLLVVGN